MKLRLLFSALLLQAGILSAQNGSADKLAKAILEDVRFDSIQVRALKLLTGFSAGTSYSEVWIRDFNIQVMPQYLLN